MNLSQFVAQPRSRALVASGILAALAVALPAVADSIPVTNSSFELPTTTFVNPQIDSWDKTPQPAWFDPAAAGFEWNQLSGVFANPAVGQPTHIDNLDGNQAAYIIALPAAGFGQVLGATYQVGLQYEVNVGVGVGGTAPAGSSLQIGFFYLDGANNPVTIGGASVAYSADTFPNSTHLVDKQFVLPAVLPGDAWAGKNLGVGLIVTAGDGTGNWNADNVRVTTTVVPEPGTWALLALGLGGLVAVTRRGASKK